MIKKTIKYTDYNGTETEEDWYFDLNKAELITMQMSYKNGFENYIKQIIKIQDQTELFAIFNDLVLKSVGKKSEDGKRFIKNPEITMDFKSSPAYGELLVELLSDENFASTFMKGILPSNLNANLPDKVNDLNA